VQLGVAAMTTQVQRSAAAGSRSLGRVQPSCCFRKRNRCSRGKPECLHR
jgi:hypothetical protein